MRRTRTRLPGRPLAATVAVGAVLGLLSVPTAAPSPATAPVAATADNTATVFYYTKTKNWDRYNLHYAPDGGSWTAVPGVAMETACTDWVRKTVALGTAEGLQATFNNGSGTWDNNSGENYALGTGNITVKDGVIAHSDPCADGEDPDPTPGDGNQATVYYSTRTLGWTTANIHYQPADGSWTTVPGAGMRAACAGWWKKDVDLGTATSMKAAFNNGNGVWDNNKGADYTLPTGVTTVSDNTVAEDADDPCADEVPDTRAPTAPAEVTARADGVSVVLTWEPSTDDTGVSPRTRSPAPAEPRAMS